MAVVPRARVQVRPEPNAASGADVVRELSQPGDPGRDRWVEVADDASDRDKVLGFLGRMP